ncbi:MAG: phage portal protein [Enterocloster sp.]
MKPGEDIKFAAPTRPASGFSAFIRALCEQCGAALEIPADLLLKSFNASYSASRAALLEAWKAFKMRREWFANDFCKPIYEIWLSEAVALGRIQAPGFFSDPLIRAAWLGSDWIGPSQGQLDPTKEISAEILANQHGYSTHEQSTIRLNGGQWEANMNQLKRENEMIAEANGTTPEAQAEGYSGYRLSYTSKFIKGGSTTCKSRQSRCEFLMAPQLHPPAQPRSSGTLST